MKAKNQVMLQGPLLKNIILYTIPIILTAVLQLLFNAADLVVVGQFCGSVSLGAVGATGAVTGLIVNLFLGLSMGAGVSVAHAYGAREDENIRRTIHTALPTALVCGGFLTVVGIILSNPLLKLMGTPDEVLPLSTVYMQIYFGGVTFTMVYNFCAAILRALGDTKSPLIFLTIAGVINVVLNVIFVTQFHMNVAGVALATAVSQAVSAALTVRALMRRTDAAKLVLKQMRFYKAQLLKIIRVGLPAGLHSSLFSISNVLIQSSVNSFGEVFMSGNAAAGNIEGFVAVIDNGFYQSALNFVGQNMGARQFKRAKKATMLCLICCALGTFAASMLAISFGPQLLSIYITDSQQAIEAGMTRLSVVCATWFIAALMDTTTSALRGMGASSIPMVISVLGVCGLRIGWIYTVFQLPQFHTPQYLFMSYPITWAITFIAQLIAFFIVLRRVSRQVGESVQTQ